MQFNFERIRELAYRLWESRGRHEGRADEDWFEAERQVTSGQTPSSRAVDETSKESFPASDPPASRIPDDPPANAEAKWAAAGKGRRSNKRSGKAEPSATPETPKVGSQDAPGG